MVGGAAVFASFEEANKLDKAMTLAFKGSYYQINKEDATDQFNFYFATHMNTEPEKILEFFNLQNDTWLVKNGNKVLYDSIETNCVIYVPMIVKKFDLEEANSYGDYHASVREEKILFNLDSAQLNFHHTPNYITCDTHVKIRILCDWRLPVNFYSHELEYPRDPR